MIRSRTCLRVVDTFRQPTAWAVHVAVAVEVNVKVKVEVNVEVNVNVVT